MMMPFETDPERSVNQPTTPKLVVSTLSAVRNPEREVYHGYAGPRYTGPVNLWVAPPVSMSGSESRRIPF